MEIEEKKPLVSIIVITYNSSKYVLETLESAKAQTYKKIELIISDDSSTDNTVEICELWLKQNKDFFKRTELITVKENTGIPKNCNRGLYAAKGEWIKMIAGDDALMSNCITDNIEFVNSDENIKFCFSDFNTYINTFESKNLLINYEPKYDIRSKLFSELNQKYQLKVIIRNIMIHGPATFIKRKELLGIGGYDESYRFVEDRVTFFNWSYAGKKFYYLPLKTVNYRKNTTSVTKTSTNINPEISDFTIKYKDIIIDVFFKYYSITEKVFFYIKYSYFNHYKDKKNLSFFCKVIRRIWYYIVQIGEIKNYNSLNKYYKQSKKLI